MRVGSICGVALVGLLSAGVVWAMAGKPKDPGAGSGAAVKESESDAVIAYYFHGFARCQKCMLMEAYAAEALKTGFPEALESGRLVWRPVNTDKPENAHFKERYKLYTRALVISAVRKGEEVKWKNLPQIWKLVGNKQAFIEHVQDETRAILKEQG